MAISSNLSLPDNVVARLLKELKSFHNKYNHYFATKSKLLMDYDWLRQTLTQLRAAGNTEAEKQIRQHLPGFSLGADIPRYWLVLAKAVYEFKHAHGRLPLPHEKDIPNKHRIGGWLEFMVAASKRGELTDAEECELGKLLAGEVIEAKNNGIGKIKNPNNFTHVSIDLEWHSDNQQNKGYWGVVTTLWPISKRVSDPHPKFIAQENGKVYRILEGKKTFIGNIEPLDFLCPIEKRTTQCFKVMRHALVPIIRKNLKIGA